MNTLFGLVAGNNGFGEAFEFDPLLCGYEDLPLVITQFNAILQTDQVVSLNWQTTSDANVNYYVVECSVSGKEWDSVTIVVSTRSSSIKNYTAVDDKPHTGISYYRLKEVDQNGNIFYSDKKEITNDQPFAAGVKITNPFNSSFNVTVNSLKSNAGVMELLDLNGQVLVRKNITVYIGLNSYQINNLSVLADGIYVLHILSGNDNYSTKLIKR
jgi:fibronectin-binding autotransporter adhesin